MQLSQVNPAPPPRPKQAKAKQERRSDPLATGSVSAGDTRYYTATGTLAATGPDIGSPQWQREQEESERKEKRLEQMIRGICRGC
jgi:hypothetical protein